MSVKTIISMISTPVNQLTDEQLISLRGLLDEVFANRRYTFNISSDDKSFVKCVKEVRETTGWSLDKTVKFIKSGKSFVAADLNTTSEVIDNFSHVH